MGYSLRSTLLFEKYPVNASGKHFPGYDHYILYNYLIFTLQHLSLHTNAVKLLPFYFSILSTISFDTTFLLLSIAWEFEKKIANRTKTH